MSAVDAMSSAALPGSRGVSGFDSMSSDEFLRVIFAELAAQDPLKPNDTTTLLNQISDIRSIESDLSLGDRLQALVGQSELSSAAGLLGKTISGVSESNRRVAGVVESVSRTAEGAVLHLTGGYRVPMSQVDQIVETVEEPDGASEEGTE